MPAGARVASSFDFSERRETDYRNLLKDIIRRLGIRRWFVSVRKRV